MVADGWQVISGYRVPDDRTKFWLVSPRGNFPFLDRRNHYFYSYVSFVKFLITVCFRRSIDALTNNFEIYRTNAYIQSHKLLTKKSN